MIPNQDRELAGTSERGIERLAPANQPRPPRKWERVLRAFVAGRSLNRFDAERELHDHCLHTTVAGLQDRGVVILRHDEVVPGYAGCPTHVCRYQLDRTPENVSRALALLERDTAPRRVDRAERIGEHCAAPDRAATEPPALLEGRV